MQMRVYEANDMSSSYPTYVRAKWGTVGCMCVHIVEHVRCSNIIIGGNMSTENAELSKKKILSYPTGSREKI